MNKKIKINKMKNNNTHNPVLNFVDQILNRSLSDVVKKEFTQTKPAVNIIEQSDKYLIQFAVPGLTKSDFSIQIDHNKLTVSADIENNTQTESTKDQTKFNRKEFDFSTFSRSFIIPEKADKNTIKASYKLGILELAIQKIDLSNNDHKVNIEIK